MDRIPGTFLGVIKSFNHDNEWGFVSSGQLRAQGQKQDAFLTKEHLQCFQVGSAVEFITYVDLHGKPKARDLTPAHGLELRVGKFVISRMAVTAQEEGYLALPPGTLVEVLYVGAEDSEAEKGWFFGKEDNTTSQGWLPASHFEDPDSGASVAAKDLGLFKGCVKFVSEKYGFVACPALKAQGFSSDVYVTALQLREQWDLIVGRAVSFRAVLEGDKLKCREVKILRGMAICRGGTVMARKKVEVAADGYLAVECGVEVEVLHEGGEGEEAGWFYGKELQQQEEGWLPADAFSDPPSVKPRLPPPQEPRKLTTSVPPPPPAPPLLPPEDPPLAADVPTTSGAGEAGDSSCQEPPEPAQVQPHTNGYCAPEPSCTSQPAADVSGYGGAEQLPQASPPTKDSGYSDTFAAQPPQEAPRAATHTDEQNGTVRTQAHPAASSEQSASAKAAQEIARRFQVQLCGTGPGWEYPLVDDLTGCFAGHLRQAIPVEKSRDWLGKVMDAIQDCGGFEKPVGRQGLMSRGTKWLVRPGCSCSYRYGGTSVEATPFPAWMHHIMQVCMPLCGFPDMESWPNSCNLNCYADNSEALDWHADDEQLFRDSGNRGGVCILSLSLGAERHFDLKRRNDESVAARLQLRGGDMCTMEGHTQDHYLHRVNKGTSNSGLRVNFTWRWIRKHDNTCPHAK